MTVNTFLSPNVHHLVCGIIEDQQAKEELLPFQAADLPLSEQINLSLEIIFKDNLTTRQDFENALVKTVPLAKLIHETHKSSKGESVSRQNKILSSWLSYYVGTTITEIIEFPRNSGGAMLLLLEITAALERALGDVSIDNIKCI